MEDEICSSLLQVFNKTTAKRLTIVHVRKTQRSKLSCNRQGP